MTTPLEQPPEKTLGHSTESTERAREIAGCGHVREALRLLNEEGYLARETTRLMHTEMYRKLLEESWMNEREWQLFTCIELFDPMTAHHCFNTFLLLKEKLDGTLHGAGDAPIQLLEIIRHNNTPVSRETLLRAALLHDIGKLALPRFLLAIPHTDLPQTLAAAFPDTKKQGLLTTRGFTSEETCFDALKIHEKQSALFLDTLGFPEEALLAGSHHNYDHEVPSAHGARDVLQLGATESGLVLGDLIHLADVEEALTSKERTYKKSFPLPAALACLVEDAERGKIHPYLTFLWVKSEMPKITEEDRARLSLEETATCEKTIAKFLEKEGNVSR